MDIVVGFGARGLPLCLPSLPPPFAATLLEPGVDSVALVLRGEVFRGFHLGLYIADEALTESLSTSDLRRGLARAPGTHQDWRTIICCPGRQFDP